MAGTVEALAAGPGSGEWPARRPVAAGPRRWEEAFSAALASAGLEDAADRDRPGAASGTTPR